MNIIEAKIINDIYTKVITKGEYPDFGSPEVLCSKCMFHNIACFPSGNTAGCFHGWKKEGIDYTKKLRALGDIKQ